MYMKNLIKQGIEYGIKEYNENFDYAVDTGPNMTSTDLAEEFLIDNAPITLSDELFSELHQQIMEGIDRQIFPEYYRWKKWLKVTQK